MLVSEKMKLKYNYHTPRGERERDIEQCLALLRASFAYEKIKSCLRK